MTVYDKIRSMSKEERAVTLLFMMARSYGATDIREIMKIIDDGMIRKMSAEELARELDAIGYCPHPVGVPCTDIGCIGCIKMWLET